MEVVGDGVPSDAADLGDGTLEAKSAMFEGAAEGVLVVFQAA